MLWIASSAVFDLELKLTISLDVASGGWLVEMTTPALNPNHDPIYSRTLIPTHAIARGLTDAFVDALFIMHMKFLGFT